MRPAGTRLYDPAEVARRVAVEYGIPAEQVEAAIVKFSQTLLPAHAINRMDRAERGGGNLRASVAACSFAPARLVKLLFRVLPRNVRTGMLLTALGLSLRLVGWARTVEAVRRLFPRRRRPRAGQDWESAAGQIDAVVRDLAARHPVSLKPSETALCCWAMLRSEGWPAELVVGVDLLPSLGHYWCESGPWTLTDDRRCERFVPLVRYC